MWPPDLSPIDYAMFGHLKSTLSGTKYHSKDKLQAVFEDTWAHLDVNFMKDSYVKFRSRLEATIKAEGHFG